MSQFSVAQLTVEPGATIAAVMERLVATGSRVLFVVDQSRLVGSVSDGDIRRALLATQTMQSPVHEAMNTKVQVVREDSPQAEVNAMLARGVDVIPLVDSTGSIKRLITSTSELYVPVAEPNIGGRELNYVIECMQSSWISSTGHFVQDFESSFRDYVGGNEAVAVANGTLGLVLALQALGIGRDDEVIVPDVTFGATANAVFQVGARPVFVDVDPDTWGLSAAEVERGITSRTKAVMPVHLYGRPADMRGILEVSARHGLVVIEDCAEAFGSRTLDGHVGTLCDAGVFSFFANKTITTGEGGMVVFRDPAVASRARSTRSHGMSTARRYWHEEWGSNYRLTSLQAAVGLAQLERAEELVEAKRDIAERYRLRLGPVEALGGILPAESPGTVNSYWLYTIILPPGISRSEVVREMGSRGFETRPCFPRLSRQPAFADSRSLVTDESFAEVLDRRGLSLPSSTKLTSSTVDAVSEALVDVIQGLTAG